MRRFRGAGARWGVLGLVAGAMAGCADPPAPAADVPDAVTVDLVAADLVVADAPAPVDAPAVDVATDAGAPPVDAPDAGDPADAPDAGDPADAPDVAVVAPDVPVEMDRPQPIDVPSMDAPDVPAADRGGADAGAAPADGGECVAWPACTGPGFGTAAGSDLPSDVFYAGAELGDFDGDGILDVVSTAEAAGYLVWVRGQGGGAWGPSVRLTAASPDHSFVTGEFTGDAYDDVITLNGDSLGMWRGSSTGPQRMGSVPFSAITINTGVVTGDFDGDRRADVAVAGRNAANTPVVVVHLITATVRRIEVPIPGAPYHLAAGDIDGDGRAEVIATTGADNAMVAVSNVATSPVVTAIRGAGARVAHLVTANLTDAPGRELAVITASGLQLFEREGGAWVGPSEVEPIPGTSLVTADFDGDGRDDVAGTFSWWRPFQEIHVFYGAPRRADLREGVFPISGEARGVVARDVDGDRAPDFTVLQRNPRSYLSFLRNRGGRFDVPAFLRQGTTNVQPGEPRSAAGDLDGDGTPEVVSSDVSSPEAVVVYRREPCGFAPVQRVRITQRLTRLQLVDLDGDRDLDVLATHDGGLTMLWREGGAFRTAPTVRNAPSVIAAFVGDLEGDGDRDIVTQQAGGAVVIRASAPGAFDPSSPATGRSVDGLWDLDGDGRAEVIERVTNGFTIAHESGGTWTRGWQYTHPATATVQIRAAADVNGDGRLDLVGVLTAGSTVTTIFFPGAAGNTFGAPVTSAIAPPAGATLRVGDLNGDGRLDVAWHLTTTLVGLGDRTGRFTPAPTMSTLAGGQAFDLVDLNGDGRPDIVGGDPAGTAVVVARCAP